jgi:histidyl-tRNA synthetase
MSTQRLSPVSFLRHCADVASFYGFRPMREVEKGLGARRGRGGFHSFTTSTEACAARVTAERGSEPILAFYATTAPTHVPLGVSPREVGEFGMHVVGSQESLGEIVLLKTLFSIMNEWGGRVSAVRINALGDKDSKLRFERELSAYLRRHTNELDAFCKKAMGENVFSCFNCTNEACRKLLAEGPRAINFLSEKSRGHFREVLEYIESLGLPYEVDDLLMGDDREPRVVFALELSDQDATVIAGVGGRYDEYIRKMTSKKDSAIVSASLFFRKKGVTRSNLPTQQKAHQPKIYFVQLGLRAKLQGLMVVDMLRAAQVPVAQSFDAQNLGTQLQCARDQGVKHLIIMGQREALDGTVIVRSMQNSSQTIVPLTTLPRFLKTLKV